MTDGNYRRTAGALFLLSIGITAHQIALMQLLSYVQWYHFAYMVVSLALLGFGASGTFFALRRQWLLDNSGRLLPLLMLGCSLGLAAATLPAVWRPLRFDLYLLFVEPVQLIRLIIACLLFGLPFFLGGLAIALALTAGIERTGFLYFANLVGSGAGGLVGLGLTAIFTPEELSPLIALFPVVGSLLILPWRRYPIGSLIGSVTALLACLALFSFAPDLQPSQFKDISRVMNLPGAKLLTERPDPHGYTQVVTAESLRQAPGLSFSYRGKVPNYAAVLVNGDSYGSLPQMDSAGPALLDYSTEVLGYLLAEPDDILLIQPRGGGAIEHARFRKARNLVAVEPHPEVKKLLAQGVDGFGGYISIPELKLLRNDPRAFLEGDEGKYDLVRFPTVGGFGANIGLYALSEQFLLTRQAFELAWRRLKPDGALMVTTWMDYPVKKPLRLLATLVEVVESELGPDSAGQHLAALRSWGTVTFVLKKSALGEGEVDAVRRRAAELGFDPLLLPGINQEERQRFHRLPDDSFFENVDILLGDGRQELYCDYRFNIVPSTDNRPYFSQFLRLDRLGGLVEALSLRQLPFFEMGSFILALTLLILVLLAIVLIIMPLFKMGWQGEGYLRTFVYFGGLGMGYMMLEIVFIQGMTLFLGHPLTAAATVICALLISSGLGSLYSERLSIRDMTARIVVGTVCMLVIFYSFLLGSARGVGFFNGLWMQILIATLAIAPIGFILGMPFPLGLRRLHENFPEQIPWAWGINGCFSVIGPPLATVVAVQEGFRTVYILVALAYFLALCTVWTERQQGGNINSGN